MRRNRTGQRDEFAAGSFGQVVAVEVFQLVFAHVQRATARVVERYELAVTTSNFELANDEGGRISRIRLDWCPIADAGAIEQHRQTYTYYQYCVGPPHSRQDCTQGVSDMASTSVLKMPQTLNNLRFTLEGSGSS